MKTKRILFVFPVIAVLLLAAAITPAAGARIQALTSNEQLGKSIFFDANLSDPEGVACAACHGPQVGFTGPDASINALGAVYEGAVTGRFGNRKPPSAAYAGDSPILHQDEAGVWTGGMFWDGRATGEMLGDPLAEQAQGPFLNPLEQNLADEQALCNKIASSAYVSEYEAVYGPIDCVDGVGTAFVNIARAIAAFERSSEVSQFSSKYDAYLAGQAELSTIEAKGLELFEGEAGCSGCHISSTEDGSPPLFTDYTYDNIGLPRNPENPYYEELTWNPEGESWVDLGLGGYLSSVGYDESVYTPELGKQKVPTLRNVDLRPSKDFLKAYGHNGYFKSLDQIVHFYNTRDVLGNCEDLPSTAKPPIGKVCWYPPEYPDTVNSAELGNLGLTVGDEKAIVAFLKTLSDGYFTP